MTLVQAKDKVQSQVQMMEYCAMHGEWLERMGLICILFRHSWWPAKDVQCINGRAKDLLLQYGVSSGSIVDQC